MITIAGLICVGTGFYEFTFFARPVSTGTGFCIFYGMLDIFFCSECSLTTYKKPRKKDLVSFSICVGSNFFASNFLRRTGLEVPQVYDTVFRVKTKQK